MRMCELHSVEEEECVLATEQALWALSHAESSKKDVSLTGPAT